MAIGKMNNFKFIKQFERCKANELHYCKHINIKINSTKMMLHLNLSESEEMVVSPRSVQQHGNGSDMLYLMIDPYQIPIVRKDDINIFHLHDGIQHIIGYCLPLHQCVEHFKTISLSRVIKTELMDHHTEQNLTKYKFHYAPINVVPKDEKEFHKMLNGPTVPMHLSPHCTRQNRFYVRPSSPNPLAQLYRPKVDSNAMNFVMEKYQLHQNPHLIPFRLPDGLDCYIRLDLAQHCQQIHHIMPPLPFPALHSHPPIFICLRDNHHHHNNNNHHHNHHHPQRHHEELEDDSRTIMINGGNKRKMIGGDGRHKLPSK